MNLVNKSYYTLFLVFSFILAFALASVAHEEGVLVKEVEGYTFELLMEPEELVMGEPVKISVHIEDQQGNNVTGLNVQYDIAREVIQAAETEPAHYTIDHTFGTIGSFEIRVGFQENGRDIIADYDIDVKGKEASFDAIWIAALVIGLLLIWGLYARKLRGAKGKRKMKSEVGKKRKAGIKEVRKPSIITPVALTAIYLIIIFLGFSVYAFYASPAIEGCEIKIGDKVTMHCHPFLNIDICGDSKGFAWEKGTLDAWHTHKDSHKLHIHPPRAVSQEEKVQIMNLQTVARDMSFVFTAGSIQDPETGTIYTDAGDMCNDGKDNKVIITINGEEKSYQDAISYLIQDGDKIRIKYE